MSKPPIVLVPGFWLGAWAWDEVAEILRDRGHQVRALTLPGLESVDSDRRGIKFEDHVSAVVDVVEAADRPVVLAAHSGAGGVGYAASDRVPEKIAAVVYVDSGAATGAVDGNFEGVELPMSLEQLAQEENLDGISQDKLREFEARAVPHPGAAVSEGPTLRDERRLDLPSYVVCTAFTSDQYKEAVEQGYPWLDGLAELKDLTYIDLPTSHWPMWSKPTELAEVLAEIAERHG